MNGTDTVVCPNPEVRGFPRPRASDGKPAPWVASDLNNLADLDFGRWREVAENGVCQVCGKDTIGGDRFAVTAHNERDDWRPIVSGGFTHRTCMLMTQAHCPYFAETMVDRWAVPDAAIRFCVSPPSGSIDGCPNRDEAVWIDVVQCAWCDESMVEYPVLGPANPHVSH